MLGSMYGGIDPSSRVVGIAAVTDGSKGRVRAVWLGAPVVLAGHPVRERYRRLREALKPPVDLGVLSWRIEKPPPTAKADTGHARQAPIGFGVGFPGGMVAAILFELGADEVELVEPGEWRPSMLAVAALHGMRLEDAKTRVMSGATATRPEHRRLQRLETGELELAYPCGHTTVHRNLQSLKNAPPRCPTCVQAVMDPTHRARAIRDAWKAAAVEFVSGLWPGPYAEVRAGLRARETTPDHRRAGLADVCEAAGIAAHLWLLERTVT
jgi:hypothetical protein